MHLVAHNRCTSCKHHLICRFRCKNIWTNNTQQLEQTSYIQATFDKRQLTGMWRRALISKVGRLVGGWVRRYLKWTTSTACVIAGDDGVEKCLVDSHFLSCNMIYRYGCDGWKHKYIQIRTFVYINGGTNSCKQLLASKFIDAQAELM